ncbi:MAG: hypothetical protein AB8H86_15210 [Polyangiales bacterium]
MIFKEARGAAQRFAEASELPADIRATVDTLETWSELVDYLGELHEALDEADKASGTPQEQGSGLFEFYARGLGRIREYARAQSLKE